MFVHCAWCDGPILCHRPEKCRPRNEEAYDKELIKRFENPFRNMDAFRKNKDK